MTNSGISGDLFLASLLDLVSNSEDILKNLMALKNYLSGISTLEIKLVKIKRNDIVVNQLKIDLNEKKHHRTVDELRTSLNKFLNENFYSVTANNFANNVLNSLITAEANVHEKLENKIHLHELSSVDTLIDILGVTKCLDILGVFKEDFKLFCSVLPVGGGMIKSAHGLIPVPAPATVKILEKSNLKITLGPIDEELSTPTGVALLANLNPIIKKPSFSLEKMVNSVGQKKFKSFINILRIYMGEIKEKSDSNISSLLYKYNETVSIIETDVDDISGEIIGDFIHRLEKDKILDIQVIQTITKKNRPGFIIKIITDSNSKFNIIEKLINNLGTLGVRYYDVNRICIERKISTLEINIDNKNYSVHYKLSYYMVENEKKIVNIKPEYNDLREISKETGYTIRKLQSLIQIKLHKILNSN
ncbi:MAG: nickel pincer cofactor biosynthesis protein LarC [Candidatus Lokiarchaeota archaeon]|nr:nickel pincer cofactor biosynthesis protein LarC [Candidatus Lokiarchaeota archaeon]